ncbi:NAD(P)-dependent oxidoreductase [Actinomadura sp. 6N118]|uniref:NAD(P)-dependent oxidoreductase n=1 Tax=Actinomadura sp. 6N118 TaxID=3375151 RepID=UPI00378DE3FF
MTTPWRILSLPPLDHDLVRGLFASLGDAVEITFPETRDRAALHAALPETELIIGDFTGQLALDADAVAAAPRLAFVQMPSVGTDSLDLDALAAAEVPAANAAGFNARAVAEWAVGAAFALCRHLVWGDRLVRAGQWPQMELLARGPREIHTQRVGIIGYGPIGEEAARLFGVLGSPVSYWSRRRRPEASATYREFDDLLANSDILVIAIPLTPETTGLLNAEKLALLPPNALLVNVGRGGIAPDADVLAALESGRLAGAALDVFEEEPPPADHPLRTHENVLVSPHTAGGSSMSQIKLVTMVKDNIAAAVSGHPVTNVVNGVNPQVKRR